MLLKEIAGPEILELRENDSIKQVVLLKYTSSDEVLHTIRTIKHIPKRIPHKHLVKSSILIIDNEVDYLRALFGLMKALIRALTR